MLRRSFRTENEFKDFFFGDDAEKELIHDHIVEAISVAIESKEDTAYFAELTIEGEEMDINCTKQDFLPNLKNALEFYIDNEIYEKCKNLQKLIDKLS